MPCAGRERISTASPAPSSPSSHDPQVGAGPRRLGEAAQHQRVAEAQAELEAGLARLADLELGVPIAPALADHRAGDVDALGGQVLAEHAGPELAAELGLQQRVSSIAYA